MTDINRPDHSWKELSKKGGEATKQRHGLEHYSQMGKKSAQTQKEKHGEDYFKELAKKGLEARKAKKEQAKPQKNVLDKLSDLLTGEN